MNDVRRFMTERFLTEKLWNALQRVVADRARDEERIETEFSERHDDTVRRQQQTLSSLDAQFQSDESRIGSEYETVQNETVLRLDEEFESARQTYESAVFSANQECSREINEATSQYEESIWMLDSVYDEPNEDSPAQQFDLLTERMIKERSFFEAQGTQLENTLNTARSHMNMTRQGTDEPMPPPNIGVGETDALHEFYCASAAAAERQLKQLQNQWLPRQFRGLRPLWMLLILLGTLIPIAIAVKVNPLDLFTSPDSVDMDWLQLASAVGGGTSFVAMLFMYLSARTMSFSAFNNLEQNISNAYGAQRLWTKQTKAELHKLKAERDEWNAKINAQRTAAEQKAAAIRDQRIRNAEDTRAASHIRLRDLHEPILAAVTTRREKLLGNADSLYPSQLQATKGRFQTKRELMLKNHTDELKSLASEKDTQWKQMSDTWLGGFQELYQQVSRLQNERSRHFPAWEKLAMGEWNPPVHPPTMLPVGQFNVDLATLPGGLSNDQRLSVGPTTFPLQAMVNVPEQLSMTLEVDGDGRDAAVNLMQATMLRLLTSMPPGKLRFTIIDPVGLGQNFSGFMHLADYDDVLISGRIWTEQAQIEKRLADLTEHMENVFQTYLRNEFETIREYNDFAGEVAEPYHVLVIANFPTGLNESAMRRLSSIISSGPRCGVQTLISVDTRQKLPTDFDLDELRKQSIYLKWKNNQFVWHNTGLANNTFHPEACPTSEHMGEIIRAVGEKSRDARHVQVAFERVAPTADAMWTHSTIHGIDVPLGRSGATKLQHLRLGKGTSQHALIAGKTGSGKSTFLHILVTNMAMYYSPDEIEFYLVDFKKGVEFKTYASNHLPHARVIAIESDREFGLSVLTRLDEVLQERGDLFRDNGVQDVAGYRKLKPTARMPRIMLIVDEFQEFFVEDDQLSQKSSLLLDRLVRQGRAFGIHVLLGSQTLGGAYSLARSTMGQIAVRIALQCSESDAHLILSEDNMAARLLSRPGDAIYNDANGLVEGNHPFQIAWLGDEERDTYLDKVATRTRADKIEAPGTIVFEGNVPADPVHNAELIRHLESTANESTDEEAAVVRNSNRLRLWLGDPVSISVPASVDLRRQGGHNLLIVGTDETLASGIESIALLSIVAQLPALQKASEEGPQPDIVDDRPASEDDSVDDTAATEDQHKVDQQKEDVPDKAPSNDEQLRSVYLLAPEDESQSETQGGIELWDTLAETMPGRVHRVKPRRAAATVTTIHKELKRRVDADLENEAPVILMIHNLSRFRDLRRDDDDFGFSGGAFGEEKPVSVSKLFSEVLKDGPGLGIHVICWSDTWNNATRWLSNQLLREFEIRVAFQMNPNDSTNLLDTPAASRLGPNRAIVYRDDTGTAEKFRPYGRPDADWLRQVSRMMKGEGMTEASSEDLDSWMAS